MNEIKVNTSAALKHCAREFDKIPSAWNWQRLTVAMFAHQQASPRGSVKEASRIVDARKLSEPEVAALFEYISKL